MPERGGDGKGLPLLEALGTVVAPGLPLEEAWGTVLALRRLAQSQRHRATAACLWWPQAWRGGRWECVSLE